MTDTPAAAKTQDPIIELIARELAGYTGPLTLEARFGAAKANGFRVNAWSLTETLRAAGFAIVPREPTETIVHAGHFAGRPTFKHENTGAWLAERKAIRNYWRAMIEAAER